MQLKCSLQFFLYLANHHQYGKIVQDMENSILGNKDLIPKKVYDVCQLLIEWHNNYTTLSHDKDQTQKKGNNKKYITCFRCKKTGQYANECEEELPKTSKKGSKMLILDDDSSVEYKWVAENEISSLNETETMMTLQKLEDIEAKIER